MTLDRVPEFMRGPQSSFLGVGWGRDTETLKTKSLISQATLKSSL